MTSTPTPELPKVEDLSLKARIKFLLKRYAFDIFLLGTSFISFGFFILGTIDMEKMSGLSNPLAKFVSGQGKRKISGSGNFEIIDPGQSFFNQDALWVGKGDRAEVNLTEGISFEVLEKTLLIFKKPFKSDVDLLLLGTKAQLLYRNKKNTKSNVMMNLAKGKIRLKGESKAFEPADGIFQKQERAPEIPQEEESDSKAKNSSQTGLYPQHNSVIYLKELVDVPVIFTWSASASGYLVYRNTATGNTQYVPIQNQTSVQASLPRSNSSYLWQLIDSNKQIILGPFKFEVRSLSLDSTRELLKKGALKRTDIYW